MSVLVVYVAIGIAGTAWFHLIHTPRCESCRQGGGDGWMLPVNVFLWPIWIALRVAGVIR